MAFVGPFKRQHLWRFNKWINETWKQACHNGLVSSVVGYLYNRRKVACSNTIKLLCCFGSFSYLFMLQAVDGKMEKKRVSKSCATIKLWIRDWIMKKKL